MAAFLPWPLPLPLPPAPLAAICFPKQMLNLELSNYRSLINDKECKSEKDFWANSSDN
jgi:hypothetical protein